MEKTFDYWLALGLLAFLCPEAPKQNNAKHYKTRGFVVFFVGFSLVGVPLTRQNNKTTRQQTTTTTTKNHNNNNKYRQKGK